jgi:serine/threonine protein kinase
MFHAKCTINSSLLGEGSAGKVYRGKYGTIWYRRSVAVKVFDLSNPLGAYAFQREASAHALIKKLGTRYFVKVYSISQTLTTGKIVMQLYDQDLFDYLNTAGDSESVLRPIFRDVCLGVKLLHKDGTCNSSSLSSKG